MSDEDELLEINENNNNNNNFNADSIGDDAYEKRFMTYPVFSFGRRGVIPLKLFEDLDVVIRYTLFVAALSAIYLFNYDWGKENLPLIYLAFIIVTTFSRLPFLGGFSAYSLMYLVGNILGIGITIILIEITGSNQRVASFDYATGMYVCIPDPSTGAYIANPLIVPVDGDLEDVNAVLLGILLFIVTFLLLFLGKSYPLVVGSLITVNLYTAIWYIGTEVEAFPIVAYTDFLKYMRTTILGIAIFFVCLLLPLPKLFPSFVPQPRFSVNLIVVALKSVQAEFGDVMSKLLENYCHLVERDLEQHYYPEEQRNKYSNFSKHQNISTLPPSALMFYEEKLNALQEKLRMMRVLYKESGRWEAFWFTSPLPHGITGHNVEKYINQFILMIAHAQMMLHSIQDIEFHSDDESPFESPQRLIELLKESKNYILHTLTEEHNFGRCCTSGNFFGFFNEGNYPEYHPYNEEHLTDVLNFLRRKLNIKLMNIDILDTSKLNKKSIASLLPQKYPNMAFVHHVLSIILAINRMENLCKSTKGDIAYGITKKNFILNVLYHIFDFPLRLIYFLIEPFHLYYLDVVEFVLLHTGRKKPMKPHLFRYWTAIGHKFLSSFLISASISVAYLFIFIDYFRERVPSTTTIIITIVVGVDLSNPGTSFNKGVNKLAGTTLGIAISFLVISIADSDKDAVFATNIIFAFIARYLMTKPRFADMAANFLSTLFIIYYSGVIDLQSNQIQAGVAARGIAVGIGMLLSFAAIYFWPINSSFQFRYKIVTLLLDDASKIMTGIFNENNLRSNLDQFAKKFMNETFTVQNDIQEHYALAIESREELQIFKSLNFNIDFANKFIREELNVVTLICWINMQSFLAQRHTRKSGIELPEALPRAKLRMNNIIRFCLAEISRRIFYNKDSPFMIKTHLARGFSEYLESVRELSMKKDEEDAIQLLRYYSICYSYAKLCDTIVKLDKKAVAMVAYDLARREPGIPSLC